MRLVHLRTYLAAPASAGRTRSRPVRGALVRGIDAQRERLLAAALEHQLFVARSTAVALRSPTTAEAGKAASQLRMFGKGGCRILYHQSATEPRGETLLESLDGLPRAGVLGIGVDNDQRVHHDLANDEDGPPWKGQQTCSHRAEAPRKRRSMGNICSGAEHAEITLGKQEYGRCKTFWRAWLEPNGSGGIGGGGGGGGR